MEIFNVIDIIIELRNNGNWKFKRIENRVFFTKKKLDWFPTGEIKKWKFIEIIIDELRRVIYQSLYHYYKVIAKVKYVRV